MNTEAIQAVRGCLAGVKPELDVNAIGIHTRLLEERIITSFDVLDLLIHLEQASGLPIGRDQLKPGSFRDIATIARVFIVREDDK